MLFATLDLARYCLHRGPYSPGRLEAGGWKLATPENFADNNEYPPAAIFVLHPRISLMSWLIMYVTDSPASHVGLLVGRGYVVDATLGGTVLHPLSDYLDGKSWMLIKDLGAAITFEQRKSVVDFALSHVGNTTYDWLGAGRKALQCLLGGDRFIKANRRLQCDTVTLLSLPWLIQLLRKRGPAVPLLIVPGTFLALVVWRQVRVVLQSGLLSADD